MNKKLLTGLALVLILVPALALAKSGAVKNDYILAKGQSVPDDLYSVGGNVTVAGNVAGDLIAAGGNLFVSGTVLQDAVLAGGQINISGSVRDDIRAAGGNILVSGMVGDDLAAAGGQIHLVSGSVVNGNVLITGGKVTIDGRIGGELTVSGGEVTINGTVARDVRMTAGRVTIGETAVLSGNLSYSSGREASIAPGAVIRGRTEYKPTPRLDVMTGPFKAALLGLFGILLVAKLLMYLLAALVLMWLLPRHAKELVEQSLNKYKDSALVGFLVMVAVPAATLILAFTLIGLPLAFLVGLAYMALLALTNIVAPAILGVWLYRKIKKADKYELNWKTVLLGYVVAILLWKLPVIGFLFWLALALPAMGVLARALHKAVWLNR